MHLVYAIDNLWSGGAQRQAVELAVHLRRQAGLRVSFLIYRDLDFYSFRLREADIPLVLIPKPHKYHPGLWLRIRRWLREARPDVVHAFLPRPSLWVLLGVRSLPRAEQPVFLAAERSSLLYTSRVENAVQRFVYRRCDVATVNAAPARDEMSRRFGIPEERIQYLPNGIDLEDWDRFAKEEPPFELDPALSHLALIGGLRWEKNHRLTVRALARLGLERLRGWRVWFVGAETSGRSFADAVRKEVADHGLEEVVRLVPHTPRIAALMSHLDGVLLPSQFEGFPNVALEAMASQVPVIASPVGDVPTLIEHGRTGFVMERIDEPSLAHELHHLMSMTPAERAAMGREARAEVERHYAMPQVAERYRALYERLLRPRNRGVAGEEAPKV